MFVDNGHLWPITPTAQTLMCQANKIMMTTFIGRTAIVWHCLSLPSLGLMPKWLTSRSSNCLTGQSASMHLFSCPLGQVNKNSVNLCRHRLKDYYCNFMTVYVCVPTQIQKDKYSYAHTLWQKWLRAERERESCQIQHKDTRCKLVPWDRQCHNCSRIR